MSGRGFGITYNSKATPILSANWIWAIGLWDFGCAGLRTLRIVRIGAYRKYARERILLFGGIFGQQVGGPGPPQGSGVALRCVLL